MTQTVGKSMSISAIVILYCPNFGKLERLYQSVVNQVSSIIFIDNTPVSENQKINQNWINKLDKNTCHYIAMQKNVGIATAQNKGVEFAKILNIDFVLLLDQDSALPNNMVASLLSAHQKLEQIGEKVAVVAPIFLDEKTQEIANLIRHKGLRVQKVKPNTSVDYEQSDYVIASGSLIKITTLNEVGLMRDDFFIDWVDIEWGLRAKQKGYFSYVVPKVVMNHSIGDESVEFGNKNINLHSDFRNYFIVRNSVYLGLHSNLPINFRVIQLSKTPLYILFYSYHSKKPLSSLRLLLTGVKDGIIKKMGKGYFEDKRGY